MTSRASVQSACPGVNNRSCLAPTNAEIRLVRACEQRESCPQPAVLKRSRGQRLGRKGRESDSERVSSASLHSGQGSKPGIALQQRGCFAKKQFVLQTAPRRRESVSFLAARTVFKVRATEGENQKGKVERHNKVCSQATDKYTYRHQNSKQKGEGGERKVK